MEPRRYRLQRILVLAPTVVGRLAMLLAVLALGVRPVRGGAARGIDDLDCTGCSTPTIGHAGLDGRGWAIEIADSAGNVFFATSLALDSQGRPPIAYRNHDDGDLRYVTHDGSGWHIDTVDSDGVVGWHSDLALDGSGNPHISYQDLSTFDLKHARWDEDDPPRIPERCAKCHSTSGCRDFLGEDGTAAGAVDQPAKTGTVVYCTVCHNPSSHAMTTVAFPSGVEIGELGSEAVCMQCHQGTRSGGDVEEATAGLDADTVSEELSFINVHYAIAAATWLGTEVQGGYEYQGRSYVGRFEHVPDVQACTECHDAHNLMVPAEACSPCHVAVADAADLRDIRTSEEDFDGDGDQEEGLYGEIATMQEKTYPALQAYAAQVAGTPLIYADRFPYFFVDTNGDGEADSDEVAFNNQYGAWTPRLLRAAYNYHFSIQDQGSYTHNGLYVLQLLHDSLDDLGEQVSLETGDLLRPASQ